MIDQLHAIFSRTSILLPAGLLAFFWIPKFARADGRNTPTAQQPAANPSPPSNAPTHIANPQTPSVEKPIVLPKFEVNGLRERLDAREKIVAKKRWGDFMCLDNGVLIDNILFLCKYRAAHPNELARLVLFPSGLVGRHDGIGDITSSGQIDCFLVYTSGDELHARDVRYEDRVYPFYKASQISTLTDRQLLFGTNDMLEITHGSAPLGLYGLKALRYNSSIHNHEVPGSVSGDDPNLQVRYAEAKLKEIGMTAFVAPATEKTGPDNDLMLLFCANHTLFVWRPYYGAFLLSKDAYAKFGIKQVADVTAK